MLNQPLAIAANRFGLGARPGDAGRIGGDPQGWLTDQLEPAGSTAPTPGNGRARTESAAVLEQAGELRLARQLLQRRNAAAPAERNAAAEPTATAIDPDSVRDYARFLSSHYQTQAAAGYLDAIASDQPFRERLVRFWGNHFAVSADKQPVGAIAGLYRNEAIRPHVTGNFSALLTAVARHPAMLLYLDNQTSVGPNSPIASRANRNSARRAGLNENLAREILELHTLGVDGGYMQNDVIEFARSLTGWSVGARPERNGNAASAGRRANAARATNSTRANAIARRLNADDDSGTPGAFFFRAAMHEPGSKTIFGKRFGAGGVGEAEAVLAWLALQPQTAHYLATKLARHFVADTPPPALVEHLAATYLEHDGELTPVYRELVRAEASWREPLAKFKSPEEFLISSYRALDIRPQGNTLIALATQFGQRPLTPGSPAGWPDIAEHWNGGDALLKRIEWATTLGASVGDRIDASARLDDILGDVASDATRQGIRRAESGAQAIALLFAAPEFQQR